MKIKTLLLILASGIVLTSCQKEKDQQRGGEVNEKILGTWNFVGMSVNLTTSVTAGSGIDEERGVSSYSFNSTNNKGTVAIDAARFVTSAISYSYNTKVYQNIYLGGLLFNSSVTPMVGDMPQSHGEVEYKTLSQDTLHFEKGFAILEAPASQGGPITQNTTPANIGISWAQDTLILTGHIVQAQNQIINGFNARVTYNVLQVVKLKK